MADSHKLIVATLGDSIVEGSPGETTWQEWAAHPRLEFRNYGIYGQRTDEIAQRLPEAVRGADVLVVQGGINDIAQGRDVEAAASNIRATIRLAKSLVGCVVLANVLPWNNARPEQAEAIVRLNAMIAEIADAEDVQLLDFYAVLEDPDAPGRMQADWTHADGDHPSRAGYRRLGESLSYDLLSAAQSA